jgi:hypothetical protein
MGMLVVDVAGRNEVDIAIGVIIDLTAMDIVSKYLSARDQYPFSSIFRSQIFRGFTRTRPSAASSSGLSTCSSPRRR